MDARSQYELGALLLSIPALTGERDTGTFEGWRAERRLRSPMGARQVEPAAGTTGKALRKAEPEVQAGATGVGRALDTEFEIRA